MVDGKKDSDSRVKVLIARSLNANSFHKTISSPFSYWYMIDILKLLNIQKFSQLHWLN